MIYHSFRVLFSCLFFELKVVWGCVRMFVCYLISSQKKLLSNWVNMKSIVFRQWHGIAFYWVLYVVLKWLNPFSLMTLTRLINFLSETTYRLCDCVIFEFMEFSVTWSSQKFENALKISVGDKRIGLWEWSFVAKNDFWVGRCYKKYFVVSKG